MLIFLLFLVVFKWKFLALKAFFFFFSLLSFSSAGYLESGRKTQQQQQNIEINSEEETTQPVLHLIIYVNTYSLIKFFWNVYIYI